MGQAPNRTAALAVGMALAAVAARETELGRLDAVAGDGDHGAGMVRGLRAAAEAAGGGAATPGEVLREAGTAFADAAGGASGALVGNLLITIGKSLPGKDIDAGALHKAMADGLAALCKLGRAQPGDKTMIDTLDPFVRALGEQAAAGAGLTAAWRAALPAAEAGARATAGMIAKRGRASRLGERSRGQVDAGAMSMLYILQAVGEALAEGCGE